MKKRLDNIVPELNNAQKRALFKLAVDMVKADKYIHGNEVSMLDAMQQSCGIATEELEFIHYLSLQQAIASLRNVSSECRGAILDVLESIVGADNDVDEREKILLSAVKLSLGDDSLSWSTVISTTDGQAECTSRQVVYLEKKHCDEAHKVFSDRYDNLLLTKALNDVGLQLFYLPSVVEELGRQWDAVGTADSKFRLLRRSMEFIVPAGDRAKLDDLSNILKGLDTETFYRVVCSRCNIDVSSLPYNAFLMIKIQDSYMLDDDGRMMRGNDFLCIDISTELKRRILHFVELLDTPVCLLSYEGYYRILYDYLSSESAIMSDVVMNGRYDFCLKQLGYEKLKLESAPQAKTFYLLLLRYGRRGVSQECFEQALAYLENDAADELMPDGNFDILSSSRLLVAKGEEWAQVICNLMAIYEFISTKDSSNSSFLGYIANIIRHRSSLKSYINKAFMGVHGLAGKENYCVKFDSVSKSYFLPLDSACFYLQRSSMDASVAISETELWRRLSVD